MHGRTACTVFEVVNLSSVPRDVQRYPTEIHMIEIGDKRSFGFETSNCGDCPSEQFLTVDIFIAGKLLTTSDNSAYVPHFAGVVDATQRHLRNDLAWLQYRDDLSALNLSEAHHYISRTEGRESFMNWGPTTDGFSCHLIVFRGSLWITAYIYSENPDHETNAPIVDGCKVLPFDLIVTLERQAQAMRTWTDG